MKNLFPLVLILLLSASALGQKVVVKKSGVEIHHVNLFYNTLQAVKSGCPSGMLGDSVQSIVLDHTYVSYIDQADADEQALNAAKEGVAELLSCAFPSSVGFAANPNPTTDMVYFTQQVDVEVTDMQGRLVMKKAKVNSISMKHLANGVYTIKAKNYKGEVKTIMQIKL